MIICRCCNLFLFLFPASLYSLVIHRKFGGPHLQQHPPALLSAPAPSVGTSEEQFPMNALLVLAGPLSMSRYSLSHSLTLCVPLSCNCSARLASSRCCLVGDWPFDGS
ncbi:hypothetical protein Mapa_009002 [Marchantia paleacea]|nr:hypothetical protein Mapa_009002 [Marchantia paleacea]